MSIDQSITQIAMITDVSEAKVRAYFDNLIKPKLYVPIQDFWYSAKCQEYDAVKRERIRKRMRRFYRKKVGRK